MMSWKIKIEVLCGIGILVWDVYLDLRVNLKDLTLFTLIMVAFHLISFLVTLLVFECIIL
jgi:hypothetical protein